MTILVLGLLIFLGMHSLRVFANGARERMVARLGLNGWKLMYAVISILGFVFTLALDSITTW